jgi:hypothetical protein
MSRHLRHAALLVLVAAALGAGCRSRAVEKDLKVTDVETGWYDAGIVDGQNKLVPMVTFRLQNVSQEAIENVQVNAIFRRVNETEAWGDRLIRGVGSDGLAAGAKGNPLVVRSERGYTGSEARAQMLKNSQFVDAKVDVFARHGSRTWVKMGEFQIERHLVTD